MIENFTTEAQAKDEILKYCLKSKNRTISSTEIKKEIFKNTSIDVVNRLIESMGEHANPVAKVKIKGMYTKYIIADGVTELFIKKGGFAKIESDLIKSMEVKKSRSNNITNNNFGGIFIQDSDLKKVPIINKSKIVVMR